MTIGALPAWSLPAAKQRAQDLRRAVDGGEDPLAARSERRTAQNIEELWSWYEACWLGRLAESSQRDYSAMWLGKIIPYLGAKKKLQDLTPGDIQSFLDQVTKKHGATTANRCHSVLRRGLSLACNEGFLDSNPATKGIARNQEVAKERFLNLKEIERLVEVLRAKLDRAGFQVVFLLLVTGARRSEVLSMKWCDMDLEEAIWLKPARSTKQRKPHRALLNSAAVEVLKTIKIASSGSSFVFPSHSKSGHLTDVKRVWRTIREEADIGPCRIHDLRHSHASFLISEGASLEIIGEILGHSQPQTTKRYAHLYDAPLRRASEGIAKLAG